MVLHVLLLSVEITEKANPFPEQETGFMMEFLWGNLQQMVHLSKVLKSLLLKSFGEVVEIHTP